MSFLPSLKSVACLESSFPVLKIPQSSQTWPAKSALIIAVLRRKSPEKAQGPPCLLSPFPPPCGEKGPGACYLTAVGTEVPRTPFTCFAEQPPCPKHGSWEGIRQSAAGRDGEGRGWALARRMQPPHVPIHARGVSLWLWPLWLALDSCGHSHDLTRFEKTCLGAKQDGGSPLLPVVALLGN